MVPVWLKSIPSNNSISIFSFEFSVEIASYAVLPAEVETFLGPNDLLDLLNFLPRLNNPLGPFVPIVPFALLGPLVPIVPIDPLVLLGPFDPFISLLGPSFPIAPLPSLGPLAPSENCDSREMAWRNSSMLMVPVLSLSKNANAASSCRSSFYASPPRGSPTLFRWYATAVIAAFFSRLNP